MFGTRLLSSRRVVGRYGGYGYGFTARLGSSSVTAPPRRMYSVTTATTATSATTTTATATPTATTKRIPGATIGPVPNVTFKDIQDAYARIRHTVARSPLDRSPRLSQLAGCELSLKKEHLSLTGSYKERGALNKLLTLTEEERKKGVICWSAGNHAQAVSYHSTRLGIDGVIVMPVTTPHVKVAATRQFGAKVVLAGQSFGGAAEAEMEIAEREGRTLVHAFNDPMIVAGQGVRIVFCLCVVLCVDLCDG